MLYHIAYQEGIIYSGYGGMSNAVWNLNPALLESGTKPASPIRVRSDTDYPPSAPA